MSSVQISAIVFSLGVGFFSYYKKSISISGFVALLTICGLFIHFNRIDLLTILFSMFASSSLLSKIGKTKKEEAEKVVVKSGPRDYFQAICNLGTSVLFFIIYQLSYENACLIGLICSVACANADSWASELGVLSKEKPRMITNFKYVPKGISGGVTLWGSFSGLLGSVFIAIISYLLTEITIPQTIIISIIGFTGMLLDSLLGATIQALYKENNHISENPSLGQLTKGLTWVTNDVVNLLSTFFTGVIGVFIYLFVL